MRNEPPSNQTPTRLTLFGRVTAKKLSFCMMLWGLSILYAICSWNVWHHHHPDQQESLLGSPGLPWVAFYNIFLPSGKTGARVAKQIVTEQIAQLGLSFANNHLKPNGTLHVYYVTIGYRNAVSNDYISALCKRYRFECFHVNHFSEGFEEKTLQHLWEYCRRYPSPSRRVMYLHSKGTFHHLGGENQAWRRFLTAAVTHRDCLLYKSDVCNVCGLTYYPLWASFFPGNFFSASCDYVSKLIPPSQFSARIETMFYAAMNTTTLRGTLYNVNNPGNVGIGRYSSEHWIGSSPDVRPCDLLFSGLQSWTNETRTIADFSFSSAPRRPVGNEWFRFQSSTFDDIMTDEKRKRSEYFLLPGYIYKWVELYGSVPSRESWVWEWYPDGEYWKNLAGERGAGSILDSFLP